MSLVRQIAYGFLALCVMLLTVVFVKVATMPRYPDASNTDLCHFPISSAIRGLNYIAPRGWMFYSLAQYELNCKSNTRQAIAYFEAAFMLGDIESSYFLGNIYTGGLFPEKMGDGKRKLEFAAANGHMAAKELLSKRF
jgi:hypothetical protein